VPPGGRGCVCWSTAGGFSRAPEADFSLSERTVPISLSACGDAPVCVRTGRPRRYRKDQELSRFGRARSNRPQHAPRLIATPALIRHRRRTLRALHDGRVLATPGATTASTTSASGASGASSLANYSPSSANTEGAAPARKNPPRTQGGTRNERPRTPRFLAFTGPLPSAKSPCETQKV